MRILYFIIFLFCLSTSHPVKAAPLPCEDYIRLLDILTKVRKMVPTEPILDFTADDIKKLHAKSNKIRKLLDNQYAEQSEECKSILESYRLADDNEKQRLDSYLKK